MARPIPTGIVIEMEKRGFSNFDIVRYLRGKGYTPVEINDAMNHAKVKMELTKNAQDYEEEQENERQELKKQEKEEDEQEKEKEKQAEKSSINKEMFEEILLRLKHLEEKNKIQQSMLEDVKDQLPKVIFQQQSSIRKLNAEVQALHLTFSKILEPLAHNVKTISGALDMPAEKKKAEKIEKEIKKEEKEIHSIELKENPVAKKTRTRKPRKKTEKIIKKVTTITEIEKTKPKKKKGSEPGLEDIF